MTLDIRCTLCDSRAALFYKFKEKRLKGKKYFKCTYCSSIFLDPKNYPTRENEKNRYEEHNNDVEDPGYQNFVAPIVNEITQHFSENHAGLDFGAGPGPVITKLLQDQGYNVELYDPFFWNNPKALKSKYDYIACCEVIEHFHRPQKEFKLLRSLLKPGGILYCMTQLYSEEIDFSSWYYKNDPTHVFFYHGDALEWIQTHFNFSKLVIKDRLILYLS